ncbi:MAG TPA: hypothetical protein VNS22_18915 [Geminicoccus sp.]|uniref:hypothetical protein n=1 Tax=Geminicoccus sp. TaxID=2024832 RepID=UPI002C3BFEFB|nr:hypothetical protein [Geminicoccus sp.]HWL70432.1 hypothetical protein [Geminicoccus sp.]
MAEATFTSSRRTLLGRMGAASVIGVTGTAAAAPTHQGSALRSLILQWQEAIDAWQIENRIDEDSDATEAKRQVWTDLEERIFRTPARSADDLRLKIDFYRREDPLDDDDWLVGIFGDVERLLLMGGVA